MILAEFIWYLSFLLISCLSFFSFQLCGVLTA